MPEQQTLSVRISGEDMALALDLIEYHHKVGHIPKPSASDYLRYLFIRDVQEVAAVTKQRRAQMGV